MLTELCQELKNWFDVERVFDTFTVTGGELHLPFLQNGQYFRIIGSVFNDGVYKYETGLTPTTQNPETMRPVLHDETFDGAVWAMAVPPDVIALAAEIEAWQANYGGVDSPAMSPYNSESFGGYSYEKSVSGSQSGDSALSGTWKGAFYSRLGKWRKIRA